MRPTHVGVLIVLTIAVPAAAVAALFAGNQSTIAKSCFIAGNAAYEFSNAKAATHIVRIDDAAARPTLRMQLVDDAAQADFVLVDDGDSTGACTNSASVETIHLDPKATNPEVTVALSRAPADYKIFVRSAHFSERDAAALFAVMWHKAKASHLASRF